MKKGYKRYLALVLSIAMILQGPSMTVSAMSSDIDQTDVENEEVTEQENTEDSLENATKEKAEEASEDIAVDTEEPILRGPLGDTKTQISFNYEEITLKALQTYRLTAATSPEDLEYTWGSEDESIATVDENGVVCGITKGSCRIYAKSKDGSAIAYCTVNVTTSCYVVKTMEEFQSSHDYENNCNDIWEYRNPELKQLVVKFSEETEVENKKDKIYITDGNDKSCGVFTGKELAGRTVIVDGDTVRVRLESNESGTAYGFRVVDVSEFNSGDEGFVVENGVLKKYEGTAEDVVIPDGITVIGRGAFSDNETIKSVKMSDTVQTIEYEAFINCSALTDIDLGKVSKIDDYAFSNCTSLVSIVIPKTLKGEYTLYYHDDVTDSVFYGCSSLHTVIFEEGTEVVSAVCHNSGVKEVVIPESVKRLSDGAFIGCYNLKELKLPQNLVGMGAGTFTGCKLTDITIPKSVIESHYFNSKDYYTPLGPFPRCEIKNLYFEEGTKEVEAILFDGATVENVYIPEEAHIQTTYYDDIYKCSIYLPKGVIIHGKTGSYAEVYAKEHHHPFISTGEMEVIPKSVTELSISELLTSEYNGGAVEPKPEIKDGDKVLEEGKHYTLSYSSNTNAGTGYVTVTGIPENGYEGTKKVSFKINAFDFAKNNDGRLLVTYEKTVEFSKNGSKPKVSVSFKNADGTTKKLTEGKDYIVSYRNNKKYNNKEKPTIIITAKGNNFSGSKKLQFTIKERNLANANLTAADRLWVGLPNCYQTIPLLCDSNFLLLPGIDYEIRYVYESKTVVTVSGKKITREAGASVGNKDNIPKDTRIKLIATAKKGSGYTGSISSTYRLYSLKTILRSLFG